MRVPFGNILARGARCRQHFAFDGPQRFGRSIRLSIVDDATKRPVAEDERETCRGRSVKGFVRKHKVSSFFLYVSLLLGSLVAWEAAPGIRGQCRARYDLWRGHYVLTEYGLPPPERPEYERLLRERYGIQSLAVTGCIVSSSMMSYVDAYDKVSAAAARRKFGRDIFAECSQEARKNWQAKNILRHEAP
jgi:hypothetical protein